jgi:hypothetical protein
MARSFVSAAVVVAAIAGVTGCSGSATFVRPPTPENGGFGIVKVPQSDWCQWYWKREGIDLIKSAYPNFKEENGGIIAQGEVPHGQFIDGRPAGAAAVATGEKEYQIEFRVPVQPTVRTTTGAAPTGVMGLNSPPMPGTIPAGATMPPNGMPMNVGMSGQPSMPGTVLPPGPSSMGSSSMTMPPMTSPSMSSGYPSGGFGGH